MIVFKPDDFSVVKASILSRGDVESLISVDEAIVAVEECLKAYARKEASMPSKIYLSLPQFDGDFRAMPAYYDGIAGVKWVSVYPNNIKHNLPCVLATIILSDPKTGCLLSVMDGTYITNLRTGAAGGVAAKYLARPNSSTLGLIGAGAQARTQLLAIAQVCKQLKTVKVFDKDMAAAQKFKEDLSRDINQNILLVESVSEASKADIIVTTTSSRQPVIRLEDVSPGTHINAIGADAEGKQELAPEILQVAKVIVDDVEQASHSGEINVPIAIGAYSRRDIYGTLGEIICGGKMGRESENDITVFDSTGLAIQDIACAKEVYRKAAEKYVLDEALMNT